LSTFDLFRRWLRFKRAQRRADRIVRQARARYGTLTHMRGGAAPAIDPTPTPTPVVDYLEGLTPEQQVQAEAITKAVMGQVREALDKQTDPSTRPGFNGTADIVEHPVLTKGYLPPTSMTPDERETALKGFNILDFPRGGIENFSVTRWAAALERAANTSEGTGAFKRWAPWESAWYSAIEKAQGDMVSGQDGGRRSHAA
jgi:hypothetical protein